MSIAAYFGECVDCGVMTSLWHSGRGLICGPCAIGHMDRAGELAGGPPAPAPKGEDVRRLQDALREVDLLLGGIKGAAVVGRALNERIDDLEARLRQRDERIAFLERAASELEGGGR